MAIGLGFVTILLCGWAVIGANPFVIGSWNLHHHARFYDEYPRTYRLWLVVNPVELAIALGLPSVVWCVIGLFAPRGVPVSVWSTLRGAHAHEPDRPQHGRSRAALDALHAASSGRGGVWL